MSTAAHSTLGHLCVQMNILFRVLRAVYAGSKQNDAEDGKQDQRPGISGHWTMGEKLEACYWFVIDSSVFTTHIRSFKSLVFDGRCFSILPCTCFYVYHLLCLLQLNGKG